MSTPSQAEVRRMVAAAGTIVVKVGSSSLTQPSGHLARTSSTLWPPPLPKYD